MHTLFSRFGSAPITVGGLSSSLFEMERYKLETARRFQKRINGRKFESVGVEDFKKHDQRIQNSYHKFLDYKEETLAWIMTLDATFLLKGLQFYVKHGDENSNADVKQMGRILDLTARKSIAALSIANSFGVS